MLTDEDIDKIIETLDENEFTTWTERESLLPTNVPYPWRRGRPVPRERWWKKVQKSLFIRHNLTVYTKDYAWRMYRVWKRMAEKKGYRRTGGSYNSFLSYMYRLRKLRLISFMGELPPVKGREYAYNRKYFTVTMANRYHIGWINPQFALYTLPALPERERRDMLSNTERSWLELERERTEEVSKVEAEKRGIREEERRRRAGEVILRREG